MGVTTRGVEHHRPVKITKNPYYLGHEDMNIPTVATNVATVVATGLL